MLQSVRQFVNLWAVESAATARVLALLTVASLGQRVAPVHRSLGELAWHIAVSIRSISSHTGLEFPAPDKKRDPVPSRAADIQAGYHQAATGLATAVTGWSDATLLVRDDVYGKDWPRGMTLQVLLFHEIHHRGQMTVLMRQAGLRVPDLYGPAGNREQGGGNGEP